MLTGGFVNVNTGSNNTINEVLETVRIYKSQNLPAPEMWPEEFSTGIGEYMGFSQRQWLGPAFDN